MPFVEPTDVFFNTGPLSFSVPVTLRFSQAQTPGPDRSIQAIFDDPWLDTQVGEVVQDTRQPMLTAKLSDLANVERGLLVAVTVGGQVRNYSVLEVRPDGTGIAYVPLAFEP
jgi:hypothetical protein